MNISNKVKTFGKVGNFNFDITPTIETTQCPLNTGCLGTTNCRPGYSGPIGEQESIVQKKKLMLKKQEIFTNNSAHETWHLNNVNTFQNILNFKKENINPEDYEPNACSTKYTNEIYTPFNYFNGSMSDRLIPKQNSKFTNVPSHGNSSHTSKTNHRPGASTPNTKGVDIKHGSYNRYLLKKKAINHKIIINSASNLFGTWLAYTWEGAPPAVFLDRCFNIK